MRGRLPGTEQEKAMPSPEEGPMVLCMLCGQSNPAGAVWCSNCRGVWRRVAAAPGDKALTTEERLRRWRRTTIIRRALLATVSVAVVVFLAIYSLELTVPPLPTPSSTINSASGIGEWAMSTRNLSGPGPVPGEGGAFVGRVRWAVKTSGSMVSTPAIQGGRVYFTTYDGRVVALDEATGSQLWEYRGSGVIYSSPAVAGDLLFYGGLDSTVTALDADTGEKRWQFEAQTMIMGSPIVHDGVVYIGSGGGHVYALDAMTGERRWSHTATGGIVNTPALAGDILVVSSVDGAVHLYDIGTGKRRFVFGDIGGRIEGSPLVVGDSVYGVASNGRAYSLDLREKEVPLAKGWYNTRIQLYLWGMMGYPGAPKGLKWITPLGGTLVTTPTADEDTLYISSNEGRLHALDRTTGKVRWTFKLGGDYPSAPTVPTITVPSITIRVEGQEEVDEQAVPAMTGEEGRLTSKSGSVYLSAPTLVGDVLLVGDGDGRLHAIDTGSGEEQWVMQIARGQTSTPVVAGGTLYLASRDGTLYAIE